MDPSSYCTRNCAILLILIWTLIVPMSNACFPGGRLMRRLPKHEPPLIFKQHTPNVPENSPLASGLREGRIRKDDKRYKELVRNHNPDIVFKDEEGSGEDKIMSQRCKEKLDALAMLVMNYWPGIRLRVTEAWDQENHHTADSLHYEGRAVDITTSDRDRNKYGLLARLAAQAGFDWVYYENRMHIHASVKSDAVTKHKRVLKCFPSHSTVFTSNGHRKSMKDLQIGDQVAVFSSDQSIIYEPIIAFLHRNTTGQAEFIELRTSPSGRIFTASDEHLIYVHGSNGSQTKAMDQIRIGDTIMITNSGYMTLEKVISIRSIIDHGFYAPLTSSGTIFVDDILASCYAAVIDDRLAHAALAPLRFWYRLIGYDHDSTGVHWYAELLLRAAEMIEKFRLGRIIV